jgi:hypothetical protein
MTKLDKLYDNALKATGSPGSKKAPKKPLTVGRWMGKNHESPVGLHIVMRNVFEGGEVRDLIGTVKKVTQEEGVTSYSQVLIVHYFNGEPWPRKPHVSEVEIL